MLSSEDQTTRPRALNDRKLAHLDALSSMHLVQDEATRRRENGEVEKSVGDEAKYLKQWFDEHHAGTPPLSTKTIENKIRAQHRAAKPPKLKYRGISGPILRGIGQRYLTRTAVYRHSVRQPK